jgi:signal transduction histidine kinase
MVLGIFPLVLSLVGVFGFIKALERLRELDEKKKELINSVTHEFRSPLTAIQSFCSLLLKGVYGKLKPDLHEAVSIIRNNSLRLSQFVDDLLALAAFEPKNERLFIEEFDVVELVRSLEKIYKPLAAEKKIKLKVVVSSPSLVVKTDRAKVLQILENLLSNAIKYTEKGFVEIGAEKSDGRLSLFVKDSGVGISNEERASIFEPFFRSERHARTVKGAGLGLAIVKAYASQLQAELGVESELGVGSKFSLKMERVI